MYAKVIIDIIHEQLDKVFEYRIPAELEHVIHVGMEVVVPFGKGNRETTGYVVDLCEDCVYEPEKVKEILNVYEVVFVKGEKQLKEMYSGEYTNGHYKRGVE